MKIKDVAIIGSGVSGATAAFHLAKLGRDIVVLEKSKKENSCKICGGGMSSSVQKYFSFDLSPAIEETINSVEFTWELKDNVIADLPGLSPFWIINRKYLDNLIINKAIDHGASLIEEFFVNEIKKDGKVWEVKSNRGEKLLAKSIIIADGSNSPWPKIFGLGARIPQKAKTISITIKGRGNLKDRTSRFEFGLIKHGFAWAFPTKDRVNIGAGTFIGKSSTNNKEMLEVFISSLGFKPKQEEIQENLLNVWNGHHRLDGEGIILTGDAASLCDPFLAEGIRPAIISGYEASKYLNNWLIGESKNLKGYSLSMKEKWGNSMAWGKKIAQVFYRFPLIGYQLGVKRATAPKRIAEILSGDLGYGDIAQRAIKRLIMKGK